MCNIYQETDIEDIRKEHKKINYSEEIWNNLIIEFKDNHEFFETKRDIINFQKKLQRKYKVTVSNCDLIKIYNFLELNNIKLKNLITKKKTKI